MARNLTILKMSSFLTSELSHHVHEGSASWVRALERARVREGVTETETTQWHQDSPTPILDWLYLGLGGAGSGMHGGDKEATEIQWPLTHDKCLMSVSAEVQVQDYSAKLGTSMPKKEKGS